MINLIVPKPSQKYFLLLNNFLFGPISADLKDVDRDIISYRSDLDDLTQGVALFDEHNVDHTKVQGDLTVQPYISSMQSFQSATDISAIQLNCTDAVLVAYYGLAYPDACHKAISSDGSVIYRAVTDYRPLGLTSIRPSTWTYVSGKLSSLTLEKMVIDIDSVSSTMFGYTWYRERRTLSGSSLPSSLSDLNTSQKFREIWDKATYSGTSSGSAGQYRRVPAQQASMILDNIKAKVNSLILAESHNTYNLPEEVDYGILAQEAITKVNANHVNMIAFLRDLRHPWELIPKLQNLKHLKGAADNFLTVDYGILPTISDLKEIFRAFNRISPYIDSHGYSTYNAFRSTSTATDISTVEVVRRIKIAIENEDDAFIALSNKVDSMGFALTLENLWDLVPYSFAIDWFIDIGGFLERVDTRMRMLRLKIRYATMSRKETHLVNVDPTPVAPICGQLSWVHYSRWTSDQCPVPPLLSSNTPTVSEHLLEAGALLVQRTK